MGVPKARWLLFTSWTIPQKFWDDDWGDHSFRNLKKKSDAQHEQPPKLACDSAIDVSFPKYPQICVDSWLNIRTNKNIAGRPLFQKTYHNFPKHNFPKVICTIFTIELPCITTHFPTVWLSFPKRDNDFFYCLI